VTRLLWPELEPEAEAAGWLPEFPSMSSADVLRAVARRHPMDGINGMPGRWVFCREVQASTGSYSDVQRFDAVAVGLTPAVRYARVVYEVKVSRADWLRELRAKVYAWSGPRTTDDLLANPSAKWDAALAVSTEYWLAAPPHCILPGELPAEAGLLEVRAWGPSREPRARVIRPAPVRETAMPDAGFWAAVLRRAAERKP
jgi:hypothetical protein